MILILILILTPTLYECTLYKLENFKAERDLLICALRLADGQDEAGKPTNLADRGMSELALEGLKTVANWTASIRELVCWKLANPNDGYQRIEMPTDVGANAQPAAKPHG